MSHLTPLRLRDRGRPRTRSGRAAVTAVVAVVASVLCTSCLMVAPTDPGVLRFRDQVFDDVTTTTDVTYGSARRQDGSTMTLRADVYEPTGDTMTLRPLVIWIHGGSFRTGSKTSAEIVDQANVFSRKGYVNASINYRLSARGCTVIDAACIESIVDATEDAQAAVRFFRANAATYRVDPDRIAVAGTSAGAITALHVGYRATVPEQSNGLDESSAVRGAVSLSGGRLLGNCDAGDAPALLFHGTSDTLVPYSWATNTVDCAADAGLRAYLTTWEGAGHVPYAANRTQILDQTTTFLFNALKVRQLL